jgi:23S rRNA (pseudouridine1915-N3)-methyltransferase
MVIDLVVVGKTDSREVAALTETYLGRVNRRVKCSLVVLPDVRAKLPPAELRRREGEMLLASFASGDCVILLDDAGDAHTSTGFAAWLEKRMASGLRRLVFVVGGAYGFSPEVYARADGRLSLSPMTFSHQIVRAIFAEQLYRAFSIINNEPYHHG